MGFYRDQIVPLLTDLSMRNKHLAAYRDRAVPAATGRVLEIGIGSGVNLPRYSPNVQQVIGLEPSPKLLGMVRGAERRNFSGQLNRRFGGGDSPGEREYRYRGDNLDIVYHPRCQPCSP